MADPLVLTPSLLAASAASLAGLAWVGPRIKRRLELSRAKHRSLAGHSRLAKRIASLLPGYAYDEEAFLASDGAPAAVVQQRRQGLAELAQEYAARYALSLASTARARERVSRKANSADATV